MEPESSMTASSRREGPPSGSDGTVFAPRFPGKGPLMTGVWAATPRSLGRGKDASSLGLSPQVPWSPRPQGQLQGQDSGCQLGDLTLGVDSPPGECRF